MSLTRKLLESLGLEADKVSTIIEAHAETVDGLKAQIDKYKAEAEGLKDAKAELKTTQAELEALKENGGDWQSKYEKEHSDFEEYKTKREAQDTLASKKEAYSKLLKDTGISDKSIAKIVKLTDFNELELEDGAIKDIEKVTENIKTDWGEFITQTDTSGADTKTPPATDSTHYTTEEISKMSPDEINKNWDAIKQSMKGNN